MNLFKNVECGFCKEKAELITISGDIYYTLITLAREFPDEWILAGNIKDGVLEEKFEVPEQVVNKASAKFKNGVHKGNCIVHSHNTMGAFHSGTDDTEGIASFQYSLVVSSDGGIIGKKKMFLPCDESFWTLAPLKIQITLPSLFSKLKELLEINMEKEPIITSETGMWGSEFDDEPETAMGICKICGKYDLVMETDCGLVCEYCIHQVCV